MRGKLYTFGRNGSNKFLHILPSACFATSPAAARAKSSAAHAMSGHQKVAKTALWAGSAPACAGLLSKPLFFASCLIVGQVAQFGNWAYSANQNKRYPRSPSDTVENYSSATL